MSGFTTEGHTSHPVWPSTAVIEFSGDPTLALDTTSTWKDGHASNDRALTPTQTHVTDCLNDGIYPQKVESNPGGSDKYIQVNEGVWLADLRLNIEESAGSNSIELGVALCDETLDTGNATIAFCEYDGKGDGFPAISDAMPVAMTCLVRFEEPSKLRLVAVNRKAASQGNAILRLGRLTLTRLCDYTVT